MSNNDLAMRFTENYYATKNEVSKELKISVIDGVWDKILSYRSSFYHYLTLKGIDKNPLRICLCPTIANKANNSETKLIRLLDEYRKLDRVNGDAQYFEMSNYIKCLQNIAVKKNLVSDEENIRSIIHGNRNVSDLSNYLDALKFIESKYVNALDMDFLAELYSLVSGNQELTYFYRDFDIDDSINHSLVARVYKSAPHVLVQQMMDNLFAFIAKSNLSPLNKALVTFYYIEFVKPFKDYNDEIAALFAKSVLAHERLNEFAAYLPLESLLNENAVEMNKKFYEVQMTSDLTYFLTFALDGFDRLIDRMLDSVAEYSTQIIKNDFFQLDEPQIDEPIKEEIVHEEERISEQKVEKAPSSEPVVVKEVIREIIREVPAPAPVVEEKPKPQVEEVKIEEKPLGLAVSYIPPELDEKTAARLERHLLELDVRLKKDQAYFYARHCTLGMFYTLEQYKKATKCVYETARTSMEKLVEYGYYKKMKAGKKFVYTPVDRK